MIKRIVEISSEPAHLAVKLDQLLIQRFDTEQRTAASIPCEDIGVVVVDHAQASMSHHALRTLMRFGAAVVVCGHDHLPAGIMVPLSTNTELVPRLHEQIAASKPIQKSLWKQVVVAKVKAQADNLEHHPTAHRKLAEFARKVRSGDPANIEAQAAKTYWSAWLLDGVPFKRDTNGDGINALLNYGYAVLRAAVARALVSAGLQPALGIHHHNRSNPFCLADDVMEPLRPMVDKVVRELVQRGRTKIGPDEKRALLGVLHVTVSIEDQIGPLMVALHRYVASLCRCLAGQDRTLLIPAVVDAET